MIHADQRNIPNPLTRPEITTLKHPKQESSLGMLSIIVGVSRSHLLRYSAVLSVQALSLLYSKKQTSG